MGRSAGRTLAVTVAVAEKPQAMVKVCFGCQRVAQPDGSWIQAAAPGGSQALAVSHGLCPQCFDRLYSRF